MRETAALASAVHPAAVLLLGDIQYPNGALLDFQGSFDPIWGTLKIRTRPAPGNHDYGTPGAGGYFDYFGAAAGERGHGYYAFDLGSWHLVALNSNCSQAGGCGEGSPQLTWLRQDLATHPARCTLAYWHHPRFSSGRHGDDASVGPLYDALARAGADLVLAGHDHHYERFARQSETGARDSGPQEIIVGTGGKSLYPEEHPHSNSEVRFHDGFGILKLTLKPDRYEWEFLAEPGVGFTDSGSEPCH
jgi:hypothetical protein